MSEIEEGLDLIDMPAAALGALLNVLRAELGAEDAARAIRRIGLEAGPFFYERFRVWLAADPATLGRDAFWGRLNDFFAELGWGRLEHEAAHPGVISLRLLEWAEARHDRDHLGCHFTTGMLADILSRIVGGELAALEVSSDSAAGGTGRILIGNPATLDALYSEIRNGVRYEDALAALG